MTSKLMTQDVPERRKYLAWGQCPQCLDFFTIELDIRFLLGTADIKGILSSRGEARIAKNRAGWTVFNENFHLRINDARVRVCNGSKSWDIFHKACSKPFRIFSMQASASKSREMAMLDKAESEHKLARETPSSAINASSEAGSGKEGECPQEYRTHGHLTGRAHVCIVANK